MIGTFERSSPSDCPSSTSCSSAEAFTRQIYAEKCDAVYQHVFDAYWEPIGTAVAQTSSTAAARAALIAGGRGSDSARRGQPDDRESVQGWSGAASMCSKQAALRSERMALFERELVD